MIFGVIASAAMIAAFKLGWFTTYSWAIYVVYGLMGANLIEFFIEIFKRKAFGKLLAILFTAAAIGIFVYFVGYKTLNWSFIS